MSATPCEKLPPGAAGGLFEWNRRLTILKMDGASGYGVKA